MRILLALVLFVATQILSGCAYLTTFNQPINLKDGSVAIDVKQRVVFSQKRPGRDYPDAVAVCAEPSPDALTVLGVSGGLTLSDGKNAINAAAGLAEGGAFVGLRTQSIQLLRDAMYRLCEGYAAGAVNQTDFAAMQRRYQSTMMGLIAIEQLTRPVVAGQALLTSAAASQSGASAGDASVDKVQQRLDTGKSAALATEGELDKAVARQTKADASSKEIRNSLERETKKKQEDRDESLISNLKDQLNSSTEEVEDSQLALADARRRHASAEDEVRQASSALRSAQARVSTTTSSGGVLGAIAYSAAQSTEYLTTGVVNIVTEINRSYMRDACLSIFTDMVKTDRGLGILKDLGTKSRASSEYYSSSEDILGRTLETCQLILDAERTRIIEIEARRPLNLK